MHADVDKDTHILSDGMDLVMNMTNGYQVPN